MNKVSEVNLVKNGVRIINIAPVYLLEQPWFCIGFEDENINMRDMFHLALVHTTHGFKNVTNLYEEIMHELTSTSPFLRIHSECILGDALHSSLCDCGEQLQKSITMISQDGGGVILYLRQEGRGIGLRAKLAALAMQEGYVAGKKSVDPCSPDEANIRCGFKIDERDYEIVPRILKSLNINSVRVITGNPDKISIIDSANIEVKEVVDIPRDMKLNKRQSMEIKEKINRNYSYPKYISYAEGMK